MLKIKPQLRLSLLIGVFFVMFFSFIATINNISSLNSELSGIEKMKLKVKSEKIDYLDNVKKGYKDEFSRGVDNETRELIRSSDVQKLSPSDPNQEQIPSISPQTLIPR